MEHLLHTGHMLHNYLVGSSLRGHFVIFSIWDFSSSCLKERRVLGTLRGTPSVLEEELMVMVAESEVDEVWPRSIIWGVIFCVGWGCSGNVVWVSTWPCVTEGGRCLPPHFFCMAVTLYGTGQNKSTGNRPGRRDSCLATWRLPWVSRAALLEWQKQFDFSNDFCDDVDPVWRCPGKTLNTNLVMFTTQRSYFGGRRIN